MCERTKLRKNDYHSLDKVLELFDRVYADLCAVSGHPRYKYFLLLTDQYSDYTFCKVMMKKTEVVPYIKFIFKFVYTKYSKKIKELHTDQGTEFANEELRLFVQKKGTKLTISTAKEPQQNGIAERKNQTNMLDISTNLNGANLPPFFWPFALTYSVHMRNITYAKKIGNLPMIEATGREPNKREYHPFGCKAVFTLLDDYLRKKLPSRGKEGLYLGLTSEDRYLIWDLENRESVATRNVKIFDNTFPFRDHHINKEYYYRVFPSEDTSYDVRPPTILDLMNRGELNNYKYKGSSNSGGGILTIPSKLNSIDQNGIESLDESIVCPDLKDINEKDQLLEEVPNDDEITSLKDTDLSIPGTFPNSDELDILIDGTWTKLVGKGLGRLGNVVNKTARNLVTLVNDGVKVISNKLWDMSDFRL